MIMQSEHKGHDLYELALWAAAIVMLIAMSWTYVW
jgi:hypothetical protein